MPQQAEYKVLEGTPSTIQKELAKLNITAAPWRPILMTSTPTTGETNLYVIVEHMIGS
jgi:hypothetical protein